MLNYWIYPGERRPVVVKADTPKEAEDKVRKSPSYDGFPVTVFRVEDFADTEEGVPPMPGAPHASTEKGKCDTTSAESVHHVHFDGSTGACCRCGKAWITENVKEPGCGPHVSSASGWGGS